MKKVLSLFLVLAMVVGSFAGLPITSQAGELPSSGKCGENVTYTFVAETGVVTISGSGDMWNHSSSYRLYRSDSIYDYYYFRYSSPFMNQECIKSVVISDGVTGIGNAAFYGCSSLTDLTIGNSVQTIGHDAFYGCSALKTVSIPASLKYIGSGGFYNCSALQQVNITDLRAWCEIDFYDYSSNPLTRAHRLYLNGEEVNNLVIPDSVTRINSNAFGGFSDLVSVTIPNSVESIGVYAFRNCNALTSITIPDSVQSIEKCAFEGCKALKTINIGSGVETIAYNTFSGCEALRIVNAASIESWSKIRFENVGASPTRYAHTLYVNGKPASDIQLPEGISQISDFAFFRCFNITSVSIPASVERIGVSAFENCIGLKSVQFSEGLKSIESDAFFHCCALESVVLPDSLEFFGARRDYWYDRDYIIPASSVFAHCEKLKSVRFGSHISQTGDGTFYGCEALEEVHISDVDAWAQMQFNTETSNPLTYAGKLYINDIELTDLVISDNVSYIGEHAFENCTSIKNISIGKNVHSIGNTTFLNASGIERISVAQGNRAFDSRNGCNALIDSANNTLILGAKYTVIPEDVEIIGIRAFAGCDGIENIVVPDAVKQIEDYAFAGCKALKTAYIGANCEHIGYDAFSACESLESIAVSEENAVYDSRENSNALIETATNSLVHGSASTIIPAGILTIDNLAFASLNGLQEITIPASVIAIGHSAFANCRNLTQLQIENGVVNIGYSAFEGCRNLKNVELPASVSNVESGAFWNCPRLESIRFANPECVICDDIKTISGKAVIFGEEDSTAFDYAMNYNHLFNIGIPTGEHHWNSGVITKAATCTTIGEITFTCVDCGETYTEQMPATGHHYQSESVASTCLSKGFTLYSCANCTEAYRDDYTPVGNDHDYKAAITKAATCTQSGTKTFTCTICADQYTEAVPMLAHTEVNDSAAAPSCTKSGLTAGTHCSTCGKVLNPQQVIKATEHNYQSSITVSATCAQSGIRTYTCTNCGDAYTEWIPMLAHTVVEDKAIAPTCTQYGLSEGKYCSVCGKVFETQQKLEPLGHAFTAVVVPATLKSNGSISYPCSRCDKESTAQVIYAPKTFALAKNSYVCTGKAIKPAVSVKDAKGKALVNGTDYRVAYSANKAVGTAKAVVTFIGHYSGTKTLTFTILPKTTNLALAAAKKAFSAKWTKLAGITGYQVQYAANAKFTGAKTVTVKGASKNALAFKNLKGGAKYFVRIRTFQTVGGKNYFSAWSAVKAVTTKR